MFESTLLLSNLKVGDEFRLTGEKGGCYFLYRPDHASHRHFIGYSHPTDLGLTIRSQLNNPDGVLVAIAVGVMNINLGLQAANLRLGDKGCYTQDGEHYITETGQNGTRSLVDAILQGKVYFKYEVKPTR